MVDYRWRVSFHRSIDLGDARLRWPSDVFAVELDGVIRSNRTQSVVDLVHEAFDEPGELMRHLPVEPLVMGGSTRPTPRDGYFESLLAMAQHGSLPAFAPRAARWRERKGIPRSTSSAEVAGNSMRTQFSIVLVELDQLGYWDDAAHPPCVDDSYETLETLGDVVERELGRAIDLEFMPRASASEAGTVVGLDQLAEDEFFELVEIFHDLAARPRSRYFHEYGHDWHHSDFAGRTGRAIYRWRVNGVLSDAQLPYRLADQGELVGRLIATFDDGRSELLRIVSENASPEEQSRLDHAISLFLRRGSTVDETRSAVKNLADFLENERNLLKAELFSKDERALFEIANKFGIRHHEASQQADYDPAFLDWVFWWYLATIELTQRLLARQP